MEGPAGLEPATPCLKGRCPNQLSYGPMYNLTAQVRLYRVKYNCFVLYLQVVDLYKFQN